MKRILGVFVGVVLGSAAIASADVPVSGGSYNGFNFETQCQNGTSSGPRGTCNTVMQPVSYMVSQDRTQVVAFTFKTSGLNCSWPDGSSRVVSLGNMPIGPQYRFQGSTSFTTVTKGGTPAPITVTTTASVDGTISGIDAKGVITIQNTYDGRGGTRTCTIATPWTAGAPQRHAPHAPSTVHKFSCTLQAQKPAINAFVKPPELVPEGYLQCSQPVTINSVDITLIRTTYVGAARRDKVLSNAGKGGFLGGSRIHCGPGGNCGDGKFSVARAWRPDPNAAYRTWIRVRVRGVTITVVGPFDRAIAGLRPHPTGPQSGPGQGF